MFLQLDETWLSAAKAYCYQHPLETLEISYFVMHHSALSTSGDKRNGRLYGYLEADQLQALLLFNDKGVLYISNQTDQLFEKVDFLKALHREKPCLVRGTEQQVARVFYFLQRALKQFEWVPTLLMGATRPLTALDAAPIVPAKTIDWRRHAAFLVQVESHFRHRALILNNLRRRLNEATSFDFYSVYCAGAAPLGQVIGEFSTWQYGVIGGLFVAPPERKKGIATALIADAAAQYAARQLKPLLYVDARNQAAQALYHKMGFQVLLQTMDLSIAL